MPYFLYFGPMYRGTIETIVFVEHFRLTKQKEKELGRFICL